MDIGAVILSTLIYRSCHIITLIDDQIQKSYVVWENMSAVQKMRMPIFSKVSTFYFKIPVEATIVIRNKLYWNDSNDKLFPLVWKLNLKLTFYRFFNKIDI